MGFLWKYFYFHFVATTGSSWEQYLLYVDMCYPLGPTKTVFACLYSFPKNCHHCWKEKVEQINILCAGMLKQKKFHFYLNAVIPNDPLEFAMVAEFKQFHWAIPRMRKLQSICLVLSNSQGQVHHKLIIIPPFYYFVVWVPVRRWELGDNWDRGFVPHRKKKFRVSIILILGSYTSY